MSTSACMDIQTLNPALVYTVKHTYTKPPEPAAQTGSVLASPCNTCSLARSTWTGLSTGKPCTLCAAATRPDSSRQSQRESCNLTPLCHFAYPYNSSQLCTSRRPAVTVWAFCPSHRSLLTIQPLDPASLEPRIPAHCRCCCCHWPWHICTKQDSTTGAVSVCAATAASASAATAAAAAAAAAQDPSCCCCCCMCCPLALVAACEGERQPGQQRPEEKEAGHHMQALPGILAAQTCIAQHTARQLNNSERCPSLWYAVTEAGDFVSCCSHTAAVAIVSEHCSSRSFS